MRNGSEQQDHSSDRDLEDRITASLAARHVPTLRNVKVQVVGDRVMLRGQVNSFYAKQLSQHSARRVAGDSQVIDEVRVVTPAGFSDRSRLEPVTAGVSFVPSATFSEPVPR
jgi:osmotically-inducible protein OsmY